MKYYYDIYIDKVLKDNNKFYFYYNDNLFNLLQCNRDKRELNDIYNLSIELINKGYPVSEIILNKQKDIVSNYENINYVLLKINCNISNDIYINDMLKISNDLMIDNKKNYLLHDNWGELWSNKIDYFEYQINELGHNKLIVLNSFSYYIGLAENAISIVNNMNLLNDIKTISLSHRRIKYPNMEIEYFNPLEFVIDLNVRDIAEYFKSMFFKTDINKTIDEFDIYIRRVKINKYDANMLFARLLYPSYYFDIYEKVIEDNLDEEKLLSIISNVNDYEIFLKKVYIELSKNNDIEQVSWIIKKEL